MINSYRLSDVKFNGDYLINNDISVFRKPINLYISDTLDTWSRDLNTDFKLGYCLFGAVYLTKIADLEKYGYGGYRIGFDACSLFLWTDGSWGNSVVIFGSDMNPFVNVDDKKKDISVFVEDSTQGLDNNTITAEAKYPINFTQSGKKLC